MHGRCLARELGLHRRVLPDLVYARSAGAWQTDRQQGASTQNIEYRELLNVLTSASRRDGEKKGPSGAAHAA